MRIAMVSEHASPLAAIGGVDAGGQNVHVAALSSALARHGHEVVVHTRRDSESQPARVAMEDGVTVEHVDAGPPAFVAKDELLPYMGEFAWKLQRRWAEDPPDVVHAHFWMSGLAALEAAQPLGIPVLQTFHALGTVKRRHQGRKDTSPPIRIEIEASIARRANRIIATCTDELFELVRMGADVDSISIVPCGVDTDLFSPTGPSLGGGPLHRLVTVGRLVERKGIDDTIRALRAVPDTELVVAGGPERRELGSDHDARRLSDLARRAGVADRVRFIGRLDRSSVPRLMRSADLAVCVPWYEPFGIVPLEAMSCAVPVVGSNVGGLSDTVVDGLTGLHVPPRDPRRLARTLRDLLDDQERRARMGTAGRSRTVERYQWTRVAEATVAAYQDAGASRPGYRMALG